MIKQLFLSIIILICASANAQDYTIRGFLHDASNGEPISDERVKLLRQDSTPVAVGYTNLAGFFSIPKLDVGSYILKVEKGKYERSFLNVEITTAATAGGANYFEMLIFGLRRYEPAVTTMYDSVTD